MDIRLGAIRHLTDGHFAIQIAGMSLPPCRGSISDGEERGTDQVIGT